MERSTRLNSLGSIAVQMVIVIDLSYTLFLSLKLIRKEDVSEMCYFQVKHKEIADISVFIFC